MANIKYKKNVDRLKKLCKNYFVVENSGNLHKNQSNDIFFNISYEQLDKGIQKFETKYYPLDEKTKNNARKYLAYLKNHSDRNVKANAEVIAFLCACRDSGYPVSYRIAGNIFGQNARRYFKLYNGARELIEKGILNNYPWEYGAEHYIDNIIKILVKKRIIKNGGNIKQEALKILNKLRKFENKYKLTPIQAAIFAVYKSAKLVKKGKITQLFSFRFENAKIKNIEKELYSTNL